MTERQPVSIDHPLLDPYRDLPRGGADRDSPLFVAEGRFVVERLLESDFETVSIVVGDQAPRSFVENLPEGIPIVRLPRGDVSRLVGFRFHSGILACGRRRRVEDTGVLAGIADRSTESRSTVIVCPFTVLPENLGAIFRLARGFGVDAIVAGQQGADPFARRTIRVSMGNVFFVPVVQPDSIAASLRCLREERGYRLLAATTDAATAVPLPMPRPAPRIAIVLGNEGQGIEPALLGICHDRITVPLAGHTDSLNVSTALAIMLYQFSQK